MRNHNRRLTPLFAALLTAGLAGSAFAAPGGQAGRAANPASPNQTRSAQPQLRAAQPKAAQTGPAQGSATQPGSRNAPRQAPQITYYSGDPLSGGTRLGTAAAGEGQPGRAPFADAPQGATHALITMPSGRRIVNLQDVAQNGGRGGAGDLGGRNGGGGEGDQGRRNGDRHDGVGRGGPDGGRPGAGNGPGRR